MSITPPDLPASYSWGFVVGQVIHAIADTTADVDRLPQARAATGTIRFEPLETLRKVTAEPTAFVAHEVVTATLGTTGELIDAEGQVGIWLVTGDYRVSFAITGAAIPGFNITVTAAHTLVAPLDLVTVSPYTPPSGATVTTLLVPAGPAEGQVLGWVSGALTWVAAGTGGGGSAPDATTTTKGIVRLAGDLGGTADAPTVPGLAGKAAASHTHAPSDVTGTAVVATDPRLSDARTPTAHTHDDRYYTEAETDTLLSGKAATGHNHTGTYAPALGADDNYVTDAEKAALHTHPAVIAQGATAAAARAAIGAGTSSLVIGTGAGDAKAGNYEPDLSGLVPTSRTVAGKALTGNITLAAADLTDFTEASQDVVGAMVAAAGGTYNDAGGSITLPAGGGGGSSSQVDIYYAVGAPGSQSSYTWTKPAGAKTVHVRMIQGGSGGGSGRRGAAGTVRCGGGGGGAGMIGTGAFPASDFGATETVNVGKGGAGGAAVTTDDTNGNTGGAGGVSAFGKLTSWAGVGGGGGTASAGSAGRSSNVVWMSNYVSAGGDSVGPSAGTASGSGGAGNDGGAYNQGHVPTAGGSGGGITSADAASAGGRGGYHNWHATLAAGGTSGGGAGSPGLAVHGLGAGGGGGGSSITGAAGNGGAGGLYGGGGGGGGASLNGYASGAGGAGGDGIVIVTSFF